MNKKPLPISLTRDETTALYYSLLKSVNELKSEASKKEIQELDRLKIRLQDHLTRYKPISRKKE